MVTAIRTIPVEIGRSGLQAMGVRGFSLLGALVLLTVPSGAAAPQLAALDKLQDGLWELRFRDGTAPRRLCLGDRWRLIQVEHPETLCDRLVVEDQPISVSVHYTCRGKGFGLTAIRRETPQLVQLDTQGIAGGLPFDHSAEGRRVGDCPPAQITSTSRPDDPRVRPRNLLVPNP